jgi:FlaG/FlaF family flagellin (archaellin)
MVAMTVVLTAVLYIMVIGMTGTDVSSSRWGAIDIDSVSPTSFDARFGDFEPDIKPTGLKIMVEFEGDEGTYTFSSDYDDNLTYSDGVDICDMYYNDQMDNGWINIGDFVRITNLSPGGTYTLYVLDAVTGGQIVTQSYTL